MQKTTLILLFTAVSFSFFGGWSHSSDSKVVNVCEYDDLNSINIVFAGDIMGHMPQVRAAYNKETNYYDFKPCYTYLKPYITAADIAVANLEVPLAGKPYKGYPNFSSPDAIFDAAVWAGFDVMLLANNHAVDRRSEGVKRTISKVSQQSKFVGVYLSNIQRDSIYPLIIEKKGLRIAFLNCTYGTNNMPVVKPQVVNRIDTAQIRKDVSTAIARKADIIIMTIHWGEEYKLKANATQVNLAKFFAQLEIDLIIGSHPHVVQNFDYVYKADSTKVPVYYSLGNFMSNQRKRHRNGGIMASVSINTQTKKISKCSYIPFYVHKGKIEGKYQYYLIPTVDYLSRVKFKLNQKQLSIDLPQKADSLLRLFNKDTQARLKELSVKKALD